MTSAKNINILGYKVFSDSLNLIPTDNNSAKVINTISPNSYGIATKDKLFDKALKNSDYLVLDGVYFALASILLKGKNIKRNQGPDAFGYFINKAASENKRVFFLGSTTDTLKKIESKLLNRFPGMQLSYYSPPFKDEFTGEDNDRMVQAVNNYKPDILFVGMTCPKQEKWAVENRDIVKTNLIICIGNVFDWVAGNQKPIHPVWYKLRLAWLIRIFLRPEIFKRNIGNQMKFFTDVLLLFLRLKKLQNA